MEVGEHIRTRYINIDEHIRICKNYGVGESMATKRLQDSENIYYKGWDEEEKYKYKAVDFIITAEGNLILVAKEGEKGDKENTKTIVCNLGDKEIFKMELAIERYKELRKERMFNGRRGL